MDVPLKMPDLATTGAAIKVLRWLVEPGRTILRGEPLLEVETDKAVMQVEAAAAGRLKSVVAAEGDEIDVGATIAILETEANQQPEPIAGKPTELTSSPVRRSFFARNREARARTTATAPRHLRPPSRAIPLSVPQKVAARRTAESKRSVPHFYLQTSANAGPMSALRRDATGERLVWDAFFVRAVGKALREFERLGGRFEDDRLILAEAPAVGVAIDIDDDLFTLTIDDPALKRLEEISHEISLGVQRLRAGDPAARVARPACLTVSNLGGSGVESFAAVINPPESAILAVGQVSPRAVVVKGKVVVQERVNLTLSVDHRVTSGKYAAGFLNRIVRELESVGRSENAHDE